MNGKIRLGTPVVAATLLILAVVGSPGAVASPSEQRMYPANGLVLFEGFPNVAEWLTNQDTGTPHDPLYELWTVDPLGGVAVNLTNTPGMDMQGQWSPDGNRIAFVSNRDGKFDIYVMQADGSRVRRLTTDRLWESWTPVWSPDGGRIVFSRANQIWVMRADGSGQRLIHTARGDAWLTDWSSDGRIILFESVSTAGGSDIWSLDLRSRRARPLYAGAGHQFGARFSPDGRKIVVSEASVCIPIYEDCLYDLVVVDSDGRNATNITNTPNISEEGPAWSPDGRQIAFSADPSVGRWEMDVWVIDAAGGVRRPLTIQPRTWDWRVDWQPLPN